jgi:putative addiction module component (TIGR02574 family)
MSIQPILDSFRKLSADEKLRLVQTLWDEIAEEAAHLPLSENHRRLLDERLQQHEENPGDVEPWELARDDVLREL